MMPDADRAALEGWLSQANERYRLEDLPPKSRPFKALFDYSKEHRCSVDGSSPLAKAIFDWFYARSAPGAHQVGSVFTGAYYFDSTFWPLHVPHIFGEHRLDALDCLETMPASIKLDLQKRPREMLGMSLHWADCVDYAYGFEDMKSLGALSPRALGFAENADRELIGAVAQLIVPRPNLKAILALRMATEIFLKALLIQELGLTDAQLKKLSHRLGEVADQCFDATGAGAFKLVARHASVFPEVSARYDGSEPEPHRVWLAVHIAQMVAGVFARRYSDRDLRSEVLSMFNLPAEPRTGSA